MNEEKKYTEAEAHRFFAAQLNGQTWDLLDKPERTKEDADLMVFAAHASCYHWLQVGTGLHHQRGEWLLARVYAVLGVGDAARHHALRCLELTQAHAELMQDFDRAYAFEAVARANAVAGRRDEALKYVELAQKAAEAIAGQEDKDYFLSDFNGGNWYGLR